MGVLSNQVAIVTGASSGIGYETAKLFAQQGAKIVVGARRENQLNALVDEVVSAGGEAVALAGDVGEERYAKELVTLAKHQFGGLDVAFNNAGTLGAMGEISEINLDAWEETLRTNLTSAYLGAKYQIPAMLERRKGSIIFTSTFVGYSAGLPGMSAYAASKSGLIGLTQVLAAEYGEKQIRINALLPGGTDTPMGEAATGSPEALEFVKGLHALKRIAQPQEIAQSALFLASSASSFTTGAAILADGGVSINKT
jgi:NAD(P)-dependent dehydrogenase (short-subunit alcohol dehydrogenase family)